MPRKRLPNFQILRVEEYPTKVPNIRVSLRAISLDELRDVDAPDGCFTRFLDTLILPKRKRGIKFRVTYTQIFQKDL